MVTAAMFAPVPWLIIPPDSSCQPFTTEVLVTADWSGAIKLFVNRWHECVCNWHHHGNSWCREEICRSIRCWRDPDHPTGRHLYTARPRILKSAAWRDAIQDCCGPLHLHVLNSFVEQGRAVQWDVNTWSCILKLCCPESEDKLADILLIYQ